MNTRTKKVTTLGIATTLIPWGLQQFLAGQSYAGIAAIAMGLLALVLYEEFQVRQLPASVDDLQDAAEELGDAARDQVEED